MSKLFPVRATCLTSAVLFLGACGSSANDNLFAGTGSATGGGGALSGGGVGGTAETGGSVSNGGTTGSGGIVGSNAGGTENGGTTGTGGVIGTGGIDGGNGSGGIISTGGVGSGGIVGTGGIGSGGVVGTGGIGSGGVVGTGGENAGTGGVVPVEGGAPPPPDGGQTTELKPTPGVIRCPGYAASGDCTIGTGAAPKECCLAAYPYPAECLPRISGCIAASGDTPIQCDDAADCALGDICCGNVKGGLTGSSCAKQCKGGTVQICHSDAECAGHQCLPLSDSSAYNSCR